MQPDRETIADRVIGAMRRFLNEHGYSPTVRDIQEMGNVSSTSVVHYWLRKFRYDGLITWEDGISRSLRFVGDHGPNDLVIHLDDDEAKLIQEACGDHDPAETSKKTLLYLAAHHRQHHPVNGHDNLFSATIAQGD